MNKNMVLLIIGAIIVAVLGLNVLNTRQAGISQQKMEVEEREDEQERGQGEREEVEDKEEADVEKGAKGTRVKEKVVEIEGRNFAFSKKQIEVDKGTKVKIVLKNVGEFPHDWVINEFNARTRQVPVGQSDTVEFVADKVGTFEYYCSVGNHRQQGMVGKLIVEE